MVGALGVTNPAEIIYLIAWSTDIDSFVHFVKGTNIKKPVVGFGVEGIKTLIIFYFSYSYLPFVSLVRKPIANISFCGYSIKTTSLKAFDWVVAKVSIICFTVL